MRRHSHGRVPTRRCFRPTDDEGDQRDVKPPPSDPGRQRRCRRCVPRRLRADRARRCRQRAEDRLDDGFYPAKTLEQTRRLVEEGEVAFLFSQLGSGPNSSIVKWADDEGVPHLCLSVNGDK